jgi:membrane-associated phospholipid phosphatase
MQTIWATEIIINLVVQHLGAWLILPMKFFTLAGTPEFFLLVMPALYWCIDPGIGRRLGILLLLTAAINFDFKLIFHGPRPFWISTQVRALDVETSFGIPSGHAQISAALWGFLARELRERWALWAAVIVIFLIGFSRIYLGMHFLSDVLAGWLIGAVILVAYAHWERPVRTWLSRRSLAEQFGLSFLTSLVVVGLGFLARAILGVYTIPPDWLRNAASEGPALIPDPLSVKNLSLLGGVWLGFTFGVAWLGNQGGFDVRGSLHVRTLRFVLGVCGVAVLYWGGGALLPDKTSAPGEILQFLSSAIIGLWISALAPMIFIRTRLARRPTPVSAVQPPVDHNVNDENRR